MFEATCWQYKDRQYPGDHKQNLRNAAQDNELHTSNRHKKRSAIKTFQTATKKIMEARTAVTEDREENKGPLTNLERNSQAMSDLDFEHHHTKMLNRIIMSGVNGASCLVKIDCTSFRLHSRGLERLVEAILGSESNGSVSTLKLSSNDVGDEGCKIIRRFLNRNSSVKSLELEDNGITGTGITTMCHALGTEGNTTLTALGLARNNVGDAGLDAISGVLSGGGPGGEQNTTLRALSVPFCGLSDDSVRRLGGLLKRNLVHLETLVLTEGQGPSRPLHCVDGDVLAHTMARALSTNTTLTSLSLADCHMSDTGFGELCANLVHNDRLQFLNVRGNGITSWGAAKLGEILHSANRTLNSIDLSSNNIVAGQDTNVLINGLEANEEVVSFLVQNNPAAQMSGFVEHVKRVMEKNTAAVQERQREKLAWIASTFAGLAKKESDSNQIIERAKMMITKEEHMARRIYSQKNPLHITPQSGKVSDAEQRRRRASTAGPAASTGRRTLQGGFNGRRGSLPFGRLPSEEDDVGAGGNKAKRPPGISRSCSSEEDDDGELKTVEGRKRAGETLDTAAWLINSESATPASQVSADRGIEQMVKIGLAGEVSNRAKESLIARLVPGSRLRLNLHKNHPRRSAGVRVVLPGHVSGDGLYEWVLHEANRVLNFPSWPGRVIYLDAPSEIKGGGKDGGDFQVLPGALVGPTDLDLLKDGMDLVISDGRGDGISSLKGYIPRGGLTADERRNLRRRNQPTGVHWSVGYWRIFSRFYRARRVLLDWEYEKSICSREGSLPSSLGDSFDGY